MKHCKNPAAKAANPVSTMPVRACPCHALTAMLLIGGLGTPSAVRDFMEVAA